jgi:fatty acyl-ACP thioesterase B
MPEEVRGGLTPWFIQKQEIKEDALEKIVKLDEEAKYMNSNLKVCHRFNHGRVTIFNINYK